jgi:hypothetical protein
MYSIPVENVKNTMYHHGSSSHQEVPLRLTDPTCSWVHGAVEAFSSLAVKRRPSDADHGSKEHPTGPETFGTVHHWAYETSKFIVPQRACW